MSKIFTRRYFLFLVLILVGSAQLLLTETVLAQCSNATPVFNVNLDGQPSGSWTSPSTNRQGLCCNVTGPQNCAQFNVILDSRSGGLQFDIISGPVPSGSMFYQVDCGPMVPVGSPICVTGSGVHELTICMPGNASNTFRITSVAAFNSVPDLKVAEGCFAKMAAPTAFNEATVTWKDITGGGAYNSYLSCTSGCSTPTITPGTNPPAFVDYVVCGTSSASLCANLPYCDTVRVYFYPPPQIAIGPSPAIICPGGTGVDLTAMVTGGFGTFQYIWTNSSGTVVGTNANYRATAVGTYSVEVRTENYPNCVKFTKSVTVSSNLTASAGPDQAVCSLNSVQLAGSVTAASGAIWSGGRGTFSPDNTTLNARYSPTASEIQAGFVKLTLTSTGNGNCTAVQDEVTINLYAVSVTLTGTTVICAGSVGSVTATVTGAQGMPTYLWNSGETTAGITGKTAGTYTVNIRDANGCTVSRSFTISEIPGPSNFTASSQSSTCGNNNGGLTISGVTSGTAPFTYSRDGVTFQSSGSFTGLPAGAYTLTVKDANGCTFAKSGSVINIPGPTSVAANTNAASCINNGNITVGTVTGGTAPYTYSLNGTTYQSGTSFNNLGAGNYTVSVKDANSCIITTGVVIGTNVPTAFNSSTVASTCGGNNGSLTITGVTGGTTPYTYSKDGANFQSSGTFNNLLDGSYTIVVRDANGCTISGAVIIKNNGGASDFGTSIKVPTCGNSNGEITISSITGGTAPFTYSKDGINFQAGNLFAGLRAGSHSIYVKDANRCIYQEEVILDDIPTPSFTATAQSSTCSSANGQITVGNMVGGVGPYTYSKDGLNFQASSIFTGLMADDYTISVRDANGCIASQFVTLTDIASPADFTGTVKSSTCSSNNGSITISSVSGGVAPFTYSKDNVTFQFSATFNNLSAGNYSITIKDANGCRFTKTVAVTNIPGPTDMAFSGKASTCFASNGEITITGITGGTTPYLYSKDGNNFQAGATFTGLAAGNHTFWVKDANGCLFSKSSTISNIAGPTSFAFSVSPASCISTGSISLGSVTGGTSPFTYSINGITFQNTTGFNNLASGNYNVTIKDGNDCTVSTSITVGTNIPTAFTHSTVSSTCGSNNGSLTITGVTGGNAPYTYSKDGINYQSSATFTNLLAGSYGIIVKDANGCSFTRSVAVSNVGGATDLITNITSSTCTNSNGQIIVNTVVGGIAPFTYSKNGVNFQASNVFTGLLAGDYQIYVKDANGCVYSEEVLINDIPGPSFTLVSQASTCSRNNGQISVNNITGGLSPYTFSKDGLNFQGSAVFTGLVAGNYTITTKDANGCLTSQAVTVNNFASPADFTASFKASTCSSSNGILTISSVNGGVAPFTYSKDGISFQASSTITNLAPGTYSVTVKDANSCTITKSYTITNIAGPTNFAATIQASTCGNNNGTITVGVVTGGTASYTYSKDGTTFQNSAIFTSLLAGTHNITVKDANGCTLSKSLTVNNIAGPSAVSATSLAATCVNNDGKITVGTVTGGTAAYTYSLDGITYQTGLTFSGLASGSYTLSAKDANGCIITTGVTVGKNVPTSFTSSTVSSACGSNNGSLTITGVTAGTGPYTYSKDGVSYQTSATFNLLVSGTYTITVRDAKGCTYTNEVVVNNIMGATDITTTVQSSACNSNNGRITVSSVTGGLAPYTYSKGGTSFQNNNFFAGLPAGAYQISIKDARGCIYSEEVIVNDIAAPTFMAKATSSTCGTTNGVITVNAVSGGVGPYTYSKDGVTFQSGSVFANVAEGSYTITVKDVNSCLSTQIVKVENIAGPENFTTNSVSSTCSATNGSITVTGVTGGTAPYTYSTDGITYQTSNTFANLSAGSYSVLVKDANGCTYARSVAVADRPSPSDFTVTTVSSTCGLANAELTISDVFNGTAPYTYSRDGINYQVSPTFSDILAGTYSITIKDANGCTFAKSVTLNDIPGPSAIRATSTAASCADNDGSISAGTVTGGTAPFTYSINGITYQPGLTFPALASGAYTLSVKDANGCIITTSISVAKNTPTAFASTTVPSTCGSSNGNLSITGVTGGTSPYTFSLNGSSFSTNTSFGNLMAGTYSVIIKDANGCTFTRAVTISNISGPTDLVATVQASSCNNSNGQITIGGVTGGSSNYTYSKDGLNFQASATFSSLAANAYLIYIKDANGCIYSEEVIVNDLAAPTFTAAATASTCGNSNGAITLNAVSGGEAPYRFSKDGLNYQTAATFLNLAEGSYTIRVKDANGCFSAQSVVINTIAGPADFTITSSASTCSRANGGLTVASVTGGTAPYTYSKDGINFQSGGLFSNLLAGNYSITVKDANGCLTSKTISLHNSGGPSDFSSTTSASTCGSSDGAITIGAITGGTAPYRYSKDGVTFQASDSFSSLLPGSYHIAIKDANGCVFTKIVAVNDKGGATAIATSTKTSACTSNTGSITINNVISGIAPYTYSLDAITFQGVTTFNGLASGTHTVYVKDANGCQSSFAVLIQTQGPQALTVAATASTCGTGNGKLTINSVKGGDAPYIYSVDATNYQAANTFDGLKAGNFTITVKDANGCTFAQAVTITNSAGPSDLILTIKSATCNNSNGDITVSSITGGLAPYTYSKDGITFQGGTTFSRLPSGNYQIYVKDANGCLYAKQVLLNDIPAPVFTLQAQPATCGNSNGNILVSGVSSGVGPYTFSKDGINYQASAVFNNLAPGNYTISVKDANGCQTSKTSEVVSISGPSDFAANVIAATCGKTNGSVTITNVTGGTAPFSYSKNGSTFQTTATLTNLLAGNYTITVKDGNGCIFTKFITINKIAGPSNLAASTFAATCGSSDGSLTVNDVTGGAAPYSYSKDGIIYQESSTFAGLAFGKYTISVQDANNCIFTKTFTIGNSNGPATAAITTGTATCANNDGSLTVGEITGGTIPYKFSLDGITFQTTAQFTGLAAGNYTVWVMDSNNCRNTFPVVVPGKGPQAAEITMVGASCGKTDGSLTVKSVTGGVGNLMYSRNGVDFQASNTFAGLKAGNYPISIKDAEGCILVISKNIENTSGVDKFTLAVTDASCGNNNGSISISDIIGDQMPYSYSINGQTYQPSATFTGLVAGTYQVYVKDAAGCIKISSVLIKNIPPVTNVSYSVTPAGCNQYKGQVVIGAVTGGTAPYVYSLDGTNFFDASSLTANAGVNAGTYTLTVKDSHQCTYTTAVTITQVSSSVASIKAVSCNNANDGAIKLYVTGPGGPVDYSINNGLTYQANPEFTNLTRGLYTIITRFASNCSITTSNIEVKEPAVLQATVKITAKAVGGLANGTAAITAMQGGTRPFTFKLDNGNFAPDSIFKNIGPGAHTMQVKDKNGCIIPVPFQMENSNEIEIPNGFTPNGDRLNDTWELANIQILYPNCKITVFNRWGSQVYQSVGYRQPWDGTFKGQGLPDGTYYCIIELNSTEPVIRKSVTIMR